MSSTKGSETGIGFVTVVKSEELGYVGGLLVVNPLGRPLEFHATAPVKPSRAHEILYGATLEPFLVGERIVGALTEAAKLPLRLVLTDRREVIDGAPAASWGPVLVRSHDDSDAAIDSTPWELRRAVGEFELAARDSSLGSRIDSMLETLAIDDLSEPFDRIREALDEARKSASRPATRRPGEAA